MGEAGLPSIAPGPAATEGSHAALHVPSWERMRWPVFGVAGVLLLVTGILLPSFVAHMRVGPTAGPPVPVARAASVQAPVPAPVPVPVEALRSGPETAAPERPSETPSAAAPGAAMTGAPVDSISADPPVVPVWALPVAHGHKKRRKPAVRASAPVVAIDADSNKAN